MRALLDLLFYYRPPSHSPNPTFLRSSRFHRKQVSSTLRRRPSPVPDKMLSSLLAVAGLFSMALADEATIYPMPQVQDWQRNSIMKLSITAPEESNAVDLNFNVIPLTTSLGLNQSAPTRGVRIVLVSLLSSVFLLHVTVMLRDARVSSPALLS